MLTKFLRLHTEKFNSSERLECTQSGISKICIFLINVENNFLSNIDLYEETFSEIRLLFPSTG
jgi:hypothetical protein